MDIPNHGLGIRNRYVSIDCQLGLKGGRLVYEISGELIERTMNT
jgi:hypothetical protein